MSKLITVGVIAKETGLPIFTVQYLLQSRKIEPMYRAGRLRVYSKDVIRRIGEEHRKIHGVSHAS